MGKLTPQPFQDVKICQTPNYYFKSATFLNYKAIEAEQNIPVVCTVKSTTGPNATRTNQSWNEIVKINICWRSMVDICPQSPSLCLKETLLHTNRLNPSFSHTLLTLISLVLPVGPHSISPSHLCLSHALRVTCVTCWTIIQSINDINETVQPSLV